MSRSTRLLDLVQFLRRSRRPVTAATLASELGVSVRTIYRDVETLTLQGAPIDGEAGLGYVLRPGFLLPPLMFSQEEIEALMLGLRLVAREGDAALVRAAGDVAAKVEAVLPDSVRRDAEAVGLLAGPVRHRPESAVDLSVLRRALRDERKLKILYGDADGRVTGRTVRPVALGFFDRIRVLVAWCETREAFRHFRVDRIAEAEILPERYSPRRAILLSDWRTLEKVSDPLTECAPDRN